MKTKKVYIFEDKEKRFRLSVLLKFLKVCPNPEKYTVFELNEKFLMFNYLHHDLEPAVIKHKDFTIQFWLNGKLIGAENKRLDKIMRHNYINLLNKKT
jgi:hypothetical protein